ncbi:hypothetical protein BKA93DRAFT_823789 [Sparassis latifolia]
MAEDPIRDVTVEHPTPPYASIESGDARSTAPTSADKYTLYDKLVVAVGAYSQTFGIPAVNEHAHFLNDVRDARAIPTKIVESHPHRRRAPEPPAFLHRPHAAEGRGVVGTDVCEGGGRGTGLAPPPLVSGITDVDKDAKTSSLLTDQHLNVRMKDTGALNPDVWAIGDAAFINGALPHSVVIFTPVASQNARYTARRLNAPALYPGAAPFRFRDAGSLAYRGGCEALYDRSRAPRACRYPGTCASSSSGYETEARRS